MILPAVLLHDHLDGGLRADTVIELAADQAYHDLPTTDPDALRTWFDQSQSGSLESYLEAFDHTIAVMQNAEALERVAYECGLDLAADGVVYVESRFCPALHSVGGLSHMQVIEAVSAGFSAAQAETGIEWRLLIDSLRHIHDSYVLARVAVEGRQLGVVGFDIAGPEAGYPPEDHLAAFDYAMNGGLRITIHAGEAGGEAGVRYIATAIHSCGAERIGHGVEIINDCIVEDDKIVHLGAVAREVLNRQIALEMCPASNLATGAIEAGEHPVGLLHRAGFNVTLSTDNRLMSDTSMSSEFEFVMRHHGFTIDDLAAVTRRSLEAAFCDHATKTLLWEQKIAPSYQKAGADVRLELK